MDPVERRAGFLRAALDSVAKPSDLFHPTEVGHRAGLTDEETEAELATLLAAKWLMTTLPPDGRVRLTNDANGGGSARASDFVRRHDERDGGRFSRRYRPSARAGA